MGSELRLRFEQEVRLLKKSRAQIARRDQTIQVREDEIKKLDQEIRSFRAVEHEVCALRTRTKNLETPMEAEVDMKKAAEAKNAELAKELESLHAQLRARRIKAVFEEFKKCEDGKVEQRCTEMDARLDALSIEFDEKLYPHMLTAIAGRRWVIGHGLRLAVMKCAESTELRQVFADAVSAGIAKGMSEGLKHWIEHGKAGRDLSDVEAYDPEASSKLTKPHDFERFSSIPLWWTTTGEVNRLPDGLIKTSVVILVYPDVRDLEDPWAVKEGVLLEKAIAANVSRAEKKRKSRIVCLTHGIGSAHHARSDGIPVFAPTVVSQGLAILLADAATQTDISEDEASPRLWILDPWPLGLQPAYTASNYQGPKDMGKLFYPILVSLAQANFDSLTQAPVCSFYESIGLRMFH
ncbi:hypothetical protein Tco_1097556 [Tanacetum coccineum]